MVSAEEFCKTLESWKRKKYIFRYKCRQCGVVYEDGVSRYEMNGDELQNFVSEVVWEKALEKSIHICGDGKIGVADLIGINSVE